MPKPFRTTMTSEECKAVRRVLLMCTKLITQNMDLTTLYAIGNGVMTGQEFLAHIATARKLVPTAYALRLVEECPQNQTVRLYHMHGAWKAGGLKGNAGLRGEVAGRKRKSTDVTRAARIWNTRKKRYGSSGQRGIGQRRNVCPHCGSTDPDNVHASKCPALRE